jgi:hypothetical protein
LRLVRLLFRCLELAKSCVFSVIKPKRVASLRKFSGCLVKSSG